MSTIIKANGVQPQASGRVIRQVAFNFGDMADQAQEYLDQVRKQAAQIVEDAQQRATAIKNQAEEEGRQAALNAAERILGERVAKQMESLRPALCKSIDDIQSAKQTWLHHWQRCAVQVATEIAGLIIRREIVDRPQITMDLIKEALELAAGSAEIKLRLNPQDHESLGPQLERLASDLAQLTQADIVADPDITPGGCRVDTKFGSIDQQFEAQLARIEQELIL